MAISVRAKVVAEIICPNFINHHSTEVAESQISGAAMMSEPDSDDEALFRWLGEIYGFLTLKPEACLNYRVSNGLDYAHSQRRRSHPRYSDMVSITRGGEI